MKKFLVTKDCNWVAGYVVNAHREGYVYANTLEEAKQIVDNEENFDYEIMEIIIDDFEIEDFDSEGQEYVFKEIIEK